MQWLTNIRHQLFNIPCCFIGNHSWGQKTPSGWFYVQQTCTTCHRQRIGYRDETETRWWMIIYNSWRRDTLKKIGLHALRINFGLEVYPWNYRWCEQMRTWASRVSTPTKGWWTVQKGYETWRTSNTSKTENH